MKLKTSQSAFTRFAKGTSRLAGQPRTFITAVLIILIWAVTGPIFKFSDTWQLVINTSTTIITFLMVFLIQNTQNRDSEATQLKLDELIRAIGGAENTLIDLEEREEGDLDQVRETYQQLANAARVASQRKKRKAAAAARAAKGSGPGRKSKSG
ncbi:MAG: low affinity iron permease family protein [Anaerolineales bacterium]